MYSGPEGSGLKEAGAPSGGVQVDSGRLNDGRSSGKVREEVDGSSEGGRNGQGSTVRFGSKHWSWVRSGEVLMVGPAVASRGGAGGLGG